MDLTIRRHELIAIGLFTLILALSSSILGGASSVSLVEELSPMLILAFMTWYLIILVANSSEIIAMIAGMLRRTRKQMPAKANLLASLAGYLIAIAVIVLFISSGVAKHLVDVLQRIAGTIEVGNSLLQRPQTNPASSSFPAAPFVYYGITVLLMIFLVSLFIFLRGLHMALQSRGQLSKEGKSEYELRKSAVDAVQLAITALITAKEYREVILQCYRRMCTILADSGIVTKQSETAREFAVGISRKLQMSTGAVHGLTFLFEEARYSNHQMTDQKRAAALNHLQSLQQELSISSGVSA